MYGWAAFHGKRGEILMGIDIGMGINIGKALSIELWDVHFPPGIGSIMSNFA